MQTDASVADPHEAETCFPPCTGLELQKDAEGNVQRRVEGKVVIVQLRSQPARASGEGGHPAAAEGSKVKFVGFEDATLDSLEGAWHQADKQKKKEAAEAEVPPIRLALTVAPPPRPYAMPD